MRFSQGFFVFLLLESSFLASGLEGSFGEGPRRPRQGYTSVTRHDKPGLSARLGSSGSITRNPPDADLDQAVRATTPYLIRGGGSSESDVVAAAPRTHAAQTARTLGYFGLWYALNVWYNIVNKRVLNAVGLPLSVAVAQLGIGSLWVVTQWLIGLRERPGKLTGNGVRRVLPVSFFHGGGQLATVLSLGAGAVSFTHIVKAMEPFFSAMVAAVCFGQIFRTPVYVSLLPVVIGVSIACFKGEGPSSFGTHFRPRSHMFPVIVSECRRTGRSWRGVELHLYHPVQN